MAKQKTLSQDFSAWQKKQGKVPAKLTYDNHPTGLAVAFPTEAAVNRRESVLAEQLWWWRKTNPDNAQQIFHLQDAPTWPKLMLALWLDNFQESSWFYEMRARYKGRHQWDFERPWVLCSAEHRRYLGCLVASEAPPALWLPSQKGQANWVNLRNMLFNLEMNDSVLAEQFLGEIERLRKLRKIDAPKKGAGVRRKLVSFLPIELMDRSFFLKTKLNDSQRSQVSKAHRCYKATCNKLGLAP